MYKICNEEKHIIENFIDKEIASKDGYLQTVRLREIKQAFCNQIKLKEFYKNKSESMKEKTIIILVNIFQLKLRKKCQTLLEMQRVE